MNEARAELHGRSIELIEWEDTTNIQAWTNLNEVREFANDGGFICYNIGFVVHEDDDCVVLAARGAFELKYQEEPQVGLMERIPKGVIRKRWKMSAIGQAYHPVRSLSWLKVSESDLMGAGISAPYLKHETPEIGPLCNWSWNTAVAGQTIWHSCTVPVVQHQYRVHSCRCGEATAAVEHGTG